jgi:ribokinase
MSRVFVAGSINMDVVATAKRHPRVGDGRRQCGVLLSRGQRREPAVAAAKLGAPTTLIGRIGRDRSAPS